MNFDKVVVRRWRRDVYRAFTAAGFEPVAIPACMVMAAIALVGTTPTALRELTGLSDAYCLKVLRRLRKQRVLSGQTLRVAWGQEGDLGNLAVVLDGMVALGECVREPDDKRSAAQRARAAETRARGTRAKATKPMGVFTPKQQASNPLYALPATEGTTSPKQRKRMKP